jgi:hypothetical protein
MTKRKRRLSRRPKAKEKRVENQISSDNTVKMKRSLGVYGLIKRQNPDPIATGKLNFQRHTLAVTK